MSRFYNNKHYTNASDYHNIVINDKRPATINVVPASSLSANTHIHTLMISDTVKDGKYVEHAVARRGYYNHYNRAAGLNTSILVNGAPISRPSALTITTTRYTRDTFSSKIAGAAAVESGPTQIWIG